MYPQKKQPAVCKNIHLIILEQKFPESNFSISPLVVPVHGPVFDFYTVVKYPIWYCTDVWFHDIR